MGDAPNPKDIHYSEDRRGPPRENQQPLSEAEILRDERQTERQAPGTATPGEPAGGE